MSELTLHRLHDDVRTAALVVAPSWPLSSVIAVNPLAGFEDRPHAEALARAEALFGARGRLALPELRVAHATGRVRDADLLDALRREVPGLDDLPPVELGGGRRSVAELLLVDLVHGADDPAPVRTERTVAEVLDEEQGTAVATAVDAAATERGLARAGALAHGHRPPRSADRVDADLRTLADALDALRVPPYAQRRYLEAHVAAQPGWAAHLRWFDAHHGTEALLEHLALRVSTEAELVGGRSWFRSDGPPPRPAAASLRARAEAVADHLGAPPNEIPTIERALAPLRRDRRAAVWTDAYERAVHDRLLGDIAALDEPDAVERADDDLDAPPPVADLVACIDVRSEGLRRQLEARSGYRTFGYAGFFGLPIRVAPLAGGDAEDQCPVLLTPGATVTEVARPGREAEAARAAGRRRAAAAADDAWAAAKHHPIAPLALAEGTGWVAGPLAAARTAAPGATSWLVDHLPRPRPARTAHDRRELPIEQQAAVVAAIWRLGLGRRPAPLVVLCGHGSRADNNPMESGLACGACGGHRGGPNARIAAAMANDPTVRATLAAEGVEIPAGTWFLAAEHDTTTDRVALLDLDEVPGSHRDLVAQLRADLDAAGDAAALDRAATLPGMARRAANRGGRLRAVRRRGRDWAEPVAELGLAGNHAFVIGPRHLTAPLDLGRRVFLHSYELDLDPDGSVLGGILTAPLVVAQWINAQYNLSTTDPEAFGSGTKALHNVVGDVGVLSGAGGDLRRGLPLQSVRAGGRLLHEPIRLLAIVEGRRAHVDAAIAGSTTLQQLIGNEWISLVAREGPGDPWQQRTASGWAPRELGRAEPQREEVPSWAAVG